MVGTGSQTPNAGVIAWSDGWQPGTKKLFDWLYMLYTRAYYWYDVLSNL